MKKLLAVGVIVLFLGVAIAPSINAIQLDAIENQIKTEYEELPLNDERVDIFLPDAHLYYHALKLRYAEVEFNESGTVIDVNLSGISSDNISLFFFQKVHFHVKNQLIRTGISWSSAIKKNNIVIGGVGMTAYGGRYNNWTQNMSYGWGWDTTPIGNYTFEIGIVGVPPWLPLLMYFHFLLDTAYLWDEGWHFIPWIEIFGGIATYQLNIHV